MDWTKVKEVPPYNPFMFELARHTRGSTKSEIAQEAGIKLRRLSQIEAGDINPTQEEVDALAGVLEYPIGFFQQWYETTIELTGCMGRSVPIDYYKYKIFRDINPPRLTLVK